MLRWIANTALKMAISTVKGKALRRYPLVFGAMWLWNRWQRSHKTPALPSGPR